jgi:hypothetical protein
LVSLERTATSAAYLLAAFPFSSIELSNLAWDGWAKSLVLTNSTSF